MTTKSQTVFIRIIIMNSNGNGNDDPNINSLMSPNVLDVLSSYLYTFQQQLPVPICIIIITVLTHSTVVIYITVHLIAE